ncbi:MAG: DUF4258 domain-containing protein [Candidatus Obscuribacterales bacterium]|nr:DUF4258 domain-containing protein [Candidatus Obscuribacterales bacterium]
MRKTRHVQSRMSQRGINQQMIDLTMQFGIAEDDRLVLGGNQLKALIAELDNIRSVALKALDKGGLVVVCVPESESLITAYRLGRSGRRAS